MRHPTDGTLRRLLDEPAGVADTDREHVAGCPTCLAELAAIRADAETAAQALSWPSSEGDLDEGWQRLLRAIQEEPAPAPVERGKGRWRKGLRSPVVAIVGVIALVAGAGAAAAADWLQIFRTERITPVVAPQADLVRIPELPALGDLRITEDINVHEVADAAAAQQATGLTVPRVDHLPAGVSGAPRYQVLDRLSGTFTFSAAKTAETIKGPLPTPPPGLDGSRYRIVAGPGLAMVWSGRLGQPNLIVARALAPTVRSDGMPFDTARDYVLSLPGLPESVAEQLEQFPGDGTTLPLFVSTDRLVTSGADVGGVKATVVTSSDGTMSGVVWAADGVVTAVAGTSKPEELLAVARGLRWR